MFWKYNSNSSPQIEALLGKEDVTLQEVMDSEDVINECRVQNKALIDFLQKPNVMEELVTLTTNEPSTELDERIRFKYSNIACELLTCDVPALNERLASDELLLEKLYNFLDNETPLNPLLASFFSKIMGALIAKKTEQNWLSYQFTCLQVLDFLKAKDNFISLLLKHLGTSAIMDLTLKLFTQVEGIETKQNILNWLDSQQIMQSLVSMFNVNVDKDRHYNVAQLLCDFIRIARDNQRNSTERADPDPLLNRLESSTIVNLLLDNILNEDKCESAIVGGIQVLLALLDVNQNSISKFNSATSYNNINDEANDMEQKQKVLNNITSVLLEKVDKFHNLLIEPPKKMPMHLTIGILDPPLGQTRLQVLKLFASVISSNNKDLLIKIIDQGTFNIMLELFFKYPWNNFLHTQVERCLILALKTYINDNDTPTPTTTTTDQKNEDLVVEDVVDSEVVIDENETANALCKHLLDNCKLIEKILEAWKDNVEQQKGNGVRQGYMGHLINILNELIDSCNKTYFGQFLKEKYPEIYTNLNEFKKNTLDDVNKIQRMLLGGAHPNLTNNNDNDDFTDTTAPFQQQQTFAEYQMQYLNSRYIDGYSGFNDEAFSERAIPLPEFDNKTDVNFDLSDNASSIQTFKEICSQTINTLDDSDDQIFEDKDNCFKAAIENGEDQKITTSNEDDSGTDDETEYENGEFYDENEVMDVDPWSSPKPIEKLEAPEPVQSDPWNNLSNNSSDANTDSWADFTSSSFRADFSEVFDIIKFAEDDKKDGGVSGNDDDEKKSINVEIAAGDQGNKEVVLNKPSTICTDDGDKTLNDDEDNKIKED